MELSILILTVVRYQQCKIITCKGKLTFEIKWQILLLHNSLQNCKAESFHFVYSSLQVLEELVNQEEYRPRYVHDVLLVLHRVLQTDNSLKVWCSIYKDSKL